jgi:cytoskeleton protein RodZ
MIEEQENKPNPFLPAGRQLRAAREAKGWSLEDVAGQLKLARRQVEALEHEAFDELPSNLFIRGFVRNYARLLQIDAAPLIEYLVGVLPQDPVHESAAAVNVEVNQTFPDMRSSSATSSSSKIVIVALLGVFIGVAAVYWYLQQPSTPDVALPELSVPEVLPASAASAVVVTAELASAVQTAAPAVVASVASRAEQASGVAASMPQATPVVGSAELTVLTESDSWVQIVDSTGVKVLSEIVRPGYERKVTGVAPFAVKIGNAPKTKLLLQGRAIDLSAYLKPGSDVVNLELK